MHQSTKKLSAIIDYDNESISEAIIKQICQRHNQLLELGEENMDSEEHEEWDKLTRALEIMNLDYIPDNDGGIIYTTK